MHWQSPAAHQTSAAGTSAQQDIAAWTIIQDKAGSSKLCMQQLWQTAEPQAALKKTAAVLLQLRHPAGACLNSS
jgi:hypothetical protein